MSLKLISWNVNGIRAVEKKGFVDLMQSWDADVICLQETKAHKEQLSDALINIGDYKSYWHSAEKKGYSSVAIYSRIEPIRVIEGMGVEEFDNEGRSLLLNTQIFIFLVFIFPMLKPNLKELITALLLVTH